MHVRPIDPAAATIPVTVHMEDPEGLTGGEEKTVTVKAAEGLSLLEVAMQHGINIEHACGAVCACSTCHVYVEQGMEQLSEPSDAEMDRVEEAPGLQINSRLSCQCIVQGRGSITMRIPAWNRNAVKEVPH